MPPHLAWHLLTTSSSPPLSPPPGVLGTLDLLHLTPLDEEQATLLSLMQASADGLMTVLNNILDFSKMEAGKLALEHVPFSLNEVLQQVRAHGAPWSSR